jgi:hypothetical protein
MLLHLKNNPICTQVRRQTRTCILCPSQNRCEREYNRQKESSAQLEAHARSISQQIESAATAVFSFVKIVLRVPVW